MNRRGFLTSLAALATTAVVPKVPAISIGYVNPIFLKVAMNAMYGKFGSRYTGGRVYYSAPDGIIIQDIVSAYPHSLTV